VPGFETHKHVAMTSVEIGMCLAIAKIYFGEQITKEDDSVYGIYGDHKIREKIEFIAPDYNQVLGKGAADWIKNNYKWFYDYFQYK
jgi:hypothetical protein